MELLLGHEVRRVKQHVSEQLFLVLHLAVPSDLRVLETWLHGIAESVDDETIQLTAAILDNGVRAAPSLGHLRDQVFVTAGAQPKAEHSGRLVVLSRQIDHLLRIADLAIGEEEDSLFEVLVACVGQHRVHWLVDVGTAHVGLESLDCTQCKIFATLVIRDLITVKEKTM